MVKQSVTKPNHKTIFQRSTTIPTHNGPNKYLKCILKLKIKVLK